ncbi:MAG TPA: hypothetical protein VIL97_04820, partial [Thermoanaerobaculia bacterium]
ALNGATRARGGDGQTGAGAGAGGSILIRAGTIAGNGSLDASGGIATTAAGGGGAIAIVYTDAVGGWLSNLIARGDASTAIRTSGAGTIYLQSPSANYGTLAIDNSGVSGGKTILPSFGLRTATAIAEAGITVDGDKWVPPYLVDHEVEVTTASGTVKGLVRLSAIDNGWYRSIDSGHYFLQESTAYDAYLVFSEQTLADRGLTGQSGGNHFFVARFASGVWQYDNNSTFVTFTPEATDRVFATFKKSGSTFTEITKLTCPNGVCGAINGIPMAEMLRGEIQTNVTLDESNPSEIVLRSTLLTEGKAPRVSVEPVDVPVAIEAGDKLQGIYRFDLVTLRNVNLIVSDVLRATAIDQTGSTISAANAGGER